MALRFKRCTHLQARENIRDRGTWEQVHYIFRDNEESPVNRDKNWFMRLKKEVLGKREESDPGKFRFSQFFKISFAH